MPWPQPTHAAQRIVRIGRADDNDVVLDFPMVSAHHAQLVVEAGQITMPVPVSDFDVDPPPARAL